MSEKDQTDSAALPPDQAVEATPAPKKKRGTSDGAKRQRKPSKYMVLLELDPEVSGPGSFVQQAEGATKKECLKAIIDKKLTGKLLIVCVHRRITATVQEVLKFS